jgi:hypothetical protein
MSTDSAKAMKSEWSALGVAAALGGAALGTYAGIHLLIPLAAAGAAMWIMRKLFSARPTHVLAAASVQAGHVAWFGFAAMVGGREILHVVWLDIALMTAGVAWLVVRPGIWPIALLGAWQIFGIALNVAAWAEAPIGTGAHKALVVHLVLRLVASGLMVSGYLALRRGAEQPTQTA